MFTHNFKYSIKILFKNKSLIFWTFAFPIILATFFNMAFSDIEKNEKLDIIDIAIIDNESFRENQIFKETFQELGNNKSKEQLFKIEYTNEEEARKLLESDKISGYLLLEEKPKVIVSKNGINQTILKYVVEEIETNSEMFQSVSERRINEKIQEEIKMDLDYNALSQEIIQETMKMLQNQKIQIKDISNPNLSYTMIEFYTLIAMTCLYGGILGMTSINKCLANMSHNGKRISISPVSTSKLSSSINRNCLIISLYNLYYKSGLWKSLTTNYSFNITRFSCRIIFRCCDFYSSKEKRKYEDRNYIIDYDARLLLIRNDGNYHEIHH